MLMVAELSGVDWRIFDGAVWRRHHPSISIGVFHHHTVYAQKHNKTSRVVSNFSYITVLTIIIN